MVTGTLFFATIYSKRAWKLSDPKGQIIWLGAKDAKGADITKHLADTSDDNAWFKMTFLECMPVFEPS